MYHIITKKQFYKFKLPLTLAKNDHSLGENGKNRSKSSYKVCKTDHSPLENVT